MTAESSRRRDEAQWRRRQMTGAAPVTPEANDGEALMTAKRNDAMPHAPCALGTEVALTMGNTDCSHRWDESYVLGNKDI